MSKLSKRDSLVLIVFGLVAVLGGLYWFYVKPAKAELSTKTGQVTEAQDNVDQLQSQLNTLTAAAKKPVTRFVGDELRLAKAYPYSTDIPIAILQLEAVAKAAHVKLGDATPDAGTDYAGVTGTAFNIAVSGKFFEVQDFIYRLHNQVHLESPGGPLVINGRLLAVTKADLSPESEATDVTGATSVQKVKATITVVAFSRAASGAPAAGGTGGASPSGTPSQPTVGNPQPISNSTGGSAS